jgi:hypothetical protein
MLTVMCVRFDDGGGKTVEVDSAGLHQAFDL